MEIILRNFRQEFHEKSTLIFAVLKYLQSLKEQLKVVDFGVKYTLNCWWFICAWLKLLGILSFF